ncbi:hypothetical protein B6V01_004300 [Methanosarcinales archaeon ex4572_44]|nr:MAG: hypothetical protein B6U67_01140 [Methanosarcinales archaeon ex4484_138]PHP45387.1 MAG: hypothetical protein B6V01_004300 [Methanosarcinales archaeon ex4572_44]RLG25343.1 MAG: hypothetical protein DRN85_06050 [Methanosarcinales archaeon]RLG28205.1 MAG: hypothetical protein DRN70_00965 [Methanosarcinales archaeon]
MPQHVVLVLNESDVLSDEINRLDCFAGWCAELDIGTLTVFVSIIEEGMGRQIGERLTEEMKENLLRVTDNIHVYCRERIVDNTRCENHGLRINLAIGYGGRFEITNAIKEIMKMIMRGELAPEEISEEVIEEHLCIQCEPDLVIRSGGRRLTDFLIWQTVYSEFYFTDVNWENYRKIDFFRAIRDYQKRQRRYGE